MDPQAEHRMKTGFDWAKERGVKDAALMRMQGQLFDLSSSWPSDTEVEILSRTHPDVLPTLRHDMAHVLAQAVKELYDDVQVTIGPDIEHGFYYDFYREISFRDEDLPVIEARMREIVKRDERFVRQEWSRPEAVAYFKAQGEHFKVELIEGLPTDEVLSVYRQGTFLDLCRGPHLPSTRYVGRGFKLTRLAGAYWRGDAQGVKLQRIYGLGFATEQDLADHLTFLDEAEKRDHRRLGREMDLFHFQEEAAGSVFWHPKGWRIYTCLQHYIRHRLEAAGYQEINTPQMLSRTFWEKSGHWDKFRHAMITCDLPEAQEHKEPLALKPMSCPGHVEVFKQGIKSYRDLPLRFSEFGACVRYEPSGALFGLMRVRAFTQDDAHIFCTPTQALEETKAFCDLLASVYKDLGFDEVGVMFSDRPKVRAGDDPTWDRAEEALKAGAEAAGLSWTLNPGEGAFYGPKLEFVLKDSLGRHWQCGTLQVDLVLPERLGARYIDASGAKQTPWMLHRAILGSFERFTGILIEHYRGRLPLWLAPVQVVVLPITNALDSYAQDVVQAFKSGGLRAQMDGRSVKIGAKIREAVMSKVPHIVVVGEQEASSRSISLRAPDGIQTVLSLQEGVDKLVSCAKMPSHG
ncbi:threonine--tRNA ligase [bacterium NHP-B]|nr:threonine--tRNA ligase [bacterium NHP-B]